MRILQMTTIGNAFASDPTIDRSDAIRVLDFMRKNKWKASDQLLQEYVIHDKYELQKTIQRLINQKAIVEIGRSD